MMKSVGQSKDNEVTSTWRGRYVTVKLSKKINLDVKRSNQKSEVVPTLVFYVL